MPSILPGYEYDIFISYRQKDNKTGWVTEFVENLKNEIEAAFKEDISIYFDENPHDGLHETHDVDGSLKEKVKCLVFIPIVSQTYCDPNAFAWQKEFLPFLDFAGEDLNIKLINGNIVKRVLPIKIYDIDKVDQHLFEKELGGAMRPLSFIYRSIGVNRPLLTTDERRLNLENVYYRDQINKVANAIRDIIYSIKKDRLGDEAIAIQDFTIHSEKESAITEFNLRWLWREIKRRKLIRATIAYFAIGWFIVEALNAVDQYNPIPVWIMKIIIMILAIGIPITISLAWHFERSPRGFIRTNTLESLYNPYSSSQKKPLASLLTIFGLVSIIILKTSFIEDAHYFNKLRQLTYTNSLSSSPSWSPDGKWIAYSSNEMGSVDIWKKPLNGGEPIRLTHSIYSERTPAWSPDNKSIIFEKTGFYRGLYQISINGGNATSILNYGSRPKWSSDGKKIVFDWQGYIYVYSFLNGKVDTIVSQLGTPPYANWLPDNERIIYWNSIVGKIYIVSVQNKVKVPLDLIPSGEDVSGLSLTNDGANLIYSKGPFGGKKSLWKVSIDYDSYVVKKSPIYIRLADSDDIYPAVSPDGKRLAFTAKRIQRHIYSYQRDSESGRLKGDPVKLTSKGDLNYYPYVSTKGKKLLMTSHLSGNGMLYTLDLENNELEKVTEEFGDSTREVEASMGKSGFPIFYSSTLENFYEIFKIESKGSYPQKIVSLGANINLVAPSISPDEKEIVFYASINNNFDIAKSGINQNDSVIFLTNSNANEICPTWSPDGSEIAYLSDVNGNYEIWKMNADGLNQHKFDLPPAREQGWSDWSPDGRWFYYSSRVGSEFNIYKVNIRGNNLEPVTTFISWDFGLPDEFWYTKFDVTDDSLIIPLEQRSGEIFLLEHTNN